MTQEAANHFYTLSILLLGVILLIFSMKYFIAGRMAKLSVSQSSFQDEVTVILTSLQLDIVETKQKITSVEAMLKEVN